MIKNPIVRYVGIGTLGILLSTGITAKADLLAYEPFDYAAGSVVDTNANGGFGFSQPWQPNLPSGANGYNQIIRAGSLVYVDSNGYQLLTGGNRIHITGDGSDQGDNTGGTRHNAQPRRAFSFSRGSATETTWVSFLAIWNPLVVTPWWDAAKGEYLYYGRATSVQLFQGTGSERLTIGTASQNAETGTVHPELPLAPNDTFRLVNRGAASYTVASTVPFTNLPPNSTANFVVVRIDHLAGDDRVNAPDTAYMWLNPSLTSEPDINNADVVSFAGTAGYERDYWFDTLRLFAGSWSSVVGYGAADVDEIRVGTTYWDVAPIVPEPSAAVLSVLGGLGLLVWRLRRKQ